MKALFLVSALISIFMACRVTRAAFSFEIKDGSSIELNKRTIESTPTLYSALFTLEQPAEILQSDTALFLQAVDSIDGLVITVYSDEDTILKNVSFPYAVDVPVRYHVSLPKGVRVGGFGIRSNAEIEFQQSGLTDSPAGFWFTDGMLFLSDDVRFGPGTAFQQEYLDDCRIDLSELFRTSSEEDVWCLSIHFLFRLDQTAICENYRADVTVTNSELASTIHVDFHGERKAMKVSIAEGVIGFTPQSVIIEGNDCDPGLSITGVEVTFYPIRSLEAIPADAAVVLEYASSIWRRADYELFSWNIRPQILIFDTANYGIQSRFFKRLAFFVEKRGFVGTIVDDEVIAHRHGYNAHDYRAKDLAAFFQKAHIEKKELRTEELLLKQILLAHDIIRMDGDILRAGHGGVISISRSSSDSLRRVLLTHECLHGLFFTSSDYREYSAHVWNELSEDERRFWTLFLSWSGYDTGNSYLMVNEFQAYLLQNDKETANLYLMEIVIPRLVRARPAEKDFLSSFLYSHADSFTLAHEKLELFLREHLHVKGGDVAKFKLMRSGDAN